LIFKAIPTPRPVLVRPHEAEGEIQRGVDEKQVHGLIEKPFPVEPVKVEAETAKASGFRQFDLPAHRLGMGQIVKAQITRNPGLVVTAKSRQSPYDIAPFGEARAPPRIVLGYAVVLRKIEGYGLDERLPARGDRGIEWLGRVRWIYAG